MDLYLNSAKEAAKYLKKLKNNSPTFHGLSLNEYAIKDLDHDGIFEILETVSGLDEKMMGYQDARWGKSTFWINVYRLEKGKYKKATSSFRDFLIERKLFYQHWYKYFKVDLSDKSIAIKGIEKNLERVAQLLKYGFYIPGNAPTPFTDY